MAEHRVVGKTDLAGDLGRLIDRRGVAGHIVTRIRIWAVGTVVANLQLDLDRVGYVDGELQLLSDELDVVLPY